MKIYKRQMNGKIRKFNKKNSHCTYEQEKFNYHQFQLREYFRVFYLGENHHDLSLEYYKSREKKFLVSIEDSVDFLIKESRQEQLYMFKEDVQTMKNKRRRKLTVLREGSDFWSCRNVARTYRTNIFHDYYNVEDEESIECDLTYISDRWNCIGRLLFIKNVITKWKTAERKELRNWGIITKDNDYIKFSNYRNI